MLPERKQNLLRHIVEVYVKTAQPVGSHFIAENYLTDVSSPTVRNEMRELEQEGYITHPHTSAGRIPTEKGYRYYIEHILNHKDLTSKQQQEISNTHTAVSDHEQQVKDIAKKVASLANEAVVVAFHAHNVYYTGLSNIFAKPEFNQQDRVVSISEVIDHLDDVMRTLSTGLEDDISVLLGTDNPFGSECGSVVTHVNFGEGRGLIGILGPMRMDYGHNIAIVKYIKQLLET